MNLTSMIFFVIRLLNETTNIFTESFFSLFILDLYP